MKNTEQLFKLAAERYADYGVDVEKALKKLRTIPLSIHAWQGDDVTGFESSVHALTGGCQVTGNHPGRARTPDELRQDLEKALKHIPGSHRVCLQAHEIDNASPGLERSDFTYRQFENWVAWAEANGVKLDIAPVFYSHPKLDHGMSASHFDPAIRRFWIDHGKAIRKIASQIGAKLQSPCVCNFWFPDGFKDITCDRMSPRMRLRDALDEIFAEEYPRSVLRDAIEPKLFGIGAESCTVGSNDFYLLYAATRKKMICFDTGHFHPTESVADKLSALFCFADELLLHVSRGVRWDSDHVIVLNDDLKSLAEELCRYDFLDKTHIGLDYFDGSINRIAAWVVGARNMQKALLKALLEPREMLRKLENSFDGAGKLALLSEVESLPFGLVWDRFCEENGVLPGMAFMDEINDYEKNVLFKRN